MEGQTEEQFQAAYRLSHAIGAGGAGEVWLATQISLGRLVVIKFIRPQMMADELSLKRFEREARVLSRLSHPFIVPVYEYGSRAGQPYLVMEYISGGSLTQRMASTGLDDLAALKLGMQIADGLDCLHREGIVHRDIKPGNILISEGGTAKLADFGLARHEADRSVTTQGPLMGTPHYLAPEVLLGADPTARSDLFALGVVLYQTLARRLPWPENVDVTELIARRVNSPPDPLERYRDDLPRTLTGLVNRLLIPDPERRPGDAAELKREIEELTEQSFGRLKGAPPILLTPREIPNQPGSVASANTSVTQVLPPAPPSAQTPKAFDGTARMKRPPRPPVATRWKVGAALGLITGVGLWVVTTRFNEPFRVESCEVKPGARALEVTYHTNRPCLTSIRITIAGSSVSRIVAPGDPPSKVHRVTIADLPEGGTVDAEVVLPDGGLATFRSKTLLIQAAALVAERLPRRMRVRLKTAVPARLKAEAMPVGRATLEDERGGTRVAISPLGLSHVLDLGPLEPRVSYELRARIVLESGEERPLDMVHLPSGIAQLMELARDVRAARLPALLEDVDRARHSAKEAPDLMPVQRALERLKWTARRDALAAIGPESALDEELTSEEKRELYDALLGLRKLDRYAEAHGKPINTDVGRLVPPDLVWGGAPVFASGPPAAWIPLNRLEGMMPDADEHVNVWSEGPRLASSTVVTLPVPPLEGMRHAQISLRAASNRAAVYQLESDSFPVPLVLVPPTDAVFTPRSVTMYHAVPVSWLKSGPMTITLRLVMFPGFFRNARGVGTVKYSDLRSNCPQPEELALHLTGDKVVPAH